MRERERERERRAESERARERERDRERERERERERYRQTDRQRERGRREKERERESPKTRQRAQWLSESCMLAFYPSHLSESFIRALIRVLYPSRFSQSDRTGRPNHRKRGGVGGDVRARTREIPRRRPGQYQGRHTSKQSKVKFNSCAAGDAFAFAFACVRLGWCGRPCLIPRSYIVFLGRSEGRGDSIVGKSSLAHGIITDSDKP